MDQKTLIEQYNYDRFLEETYQPWFRFDEAPDPGERIEDFPLLTSSGDQVSLIKEIRQHKLTILEFGSFT